MGEPEGAAEHDFERSVEEALESLPEDLRGFMSNVAILVEDEPPAGRPLLGLYQGVPLTRRGSGYGGGPPPKKSVSRGAPERPHGPSPGSLRGGVPRGGLPGGGHPLGIRDEGAREAHPCLEM